MARSALPLSTLSRSTWVVTLFASTTVTLAPIHSHAQSSSSVLSQSSANSSSATARDTTLDPSDAFRPQLRRREKDSIEIQIAVAPGYYLYRDRLVVALQAFPDPRDSAEPGAATGTVTIAAGLPAPSPPPALALTLAAGKSIDDPTFGRVEVYERMLSFQAKLPSGTPKQGLNAKVDLEAKQQLVLTSQGCAVAGVCFPPQQHTFTLPATYVAGSAWIGPIAAPVSLGFGSRRVPVTSEKAKPQ